MDLSPNFLITEDWEEGKKGFSIFVQKSLPDWKKRCMSWKFVSCVKETKAGTVISLKDQLSFWPTVLEMCIFFFSLPQRTWTLNHPNSTSIHRDGAYKKYPSCYQKSWQPDLLLFSFTLTYFKPQTLQFSSYCLNLTFFIFEF